MGATDSNNYPGIDQLEALIRELKQTIQTGKEAQQELLRVEPIVKNLKEIASSKSGQTTFFETNKTTYDVKSIPEKVTEDFWLTSNPFKGLGITDAILAYLEKFNGKTGSEIIKALEKSGTFKHIDTLNLRGTVYATLARLSKKQNKLKKIDDKWNLL
jgi:hypothetical protein